MFKNHIQRLKSKISALEVSLVASDVLQKASQERLEHQDRTIASNALLLGALRTQHANGQTEIEERQEASAAFVAEVARLRAENVALVIETTSLKFERNASKKKEANAKRSVLRSFQWREDKVDASVLRGTVAFWAATAEVVDDDDDEKKRRSNKARQNILKIIVEQGFNGELHAGMEKAFVKKKRFKVFALTKKSDLESKFNGEAIGSISHCETGHEKHMRGLIPSSTSVQKMQRKINDTAAEMGFSCMPTPKTWCWGDRTGNQLREGVHRYVKAVYYDKWDPRVTVDDPYILVLTGDLARVNLKGTKCVTVCGMKECDRRLPSQKQSIGGHENNMNQSRTLYVPAVAGYATESELMPLFEQLVELFVEIEQEKYIIVDGTRYDNVFIKVLVVADMMFLHKFTERGGCCASTTHFCMFCSCMSKFRHEGEPGGCDACRRENKVYDANGIQICLCHDMLTPEKKSSQLQRQAVLAELLRGKLPARKKPLWEDLAGLRRACLERCVPGSTNLDGSLAFKPADLTAIPKMSVAKCEAWLNQRCDGIPHTCHHKFMPYVCVPTDDFVLLHCKAAAFCQIVLSLACIASPKQLCCRNWQRDRWSYHQIR